MLPFWSPTTVSAAKLKRRPPLTTLAQRLMKTTFSIICGPSPVFWGWSRRLSRRGPRSPPPKAARGAGRGGGGRRGGGDGGGCHGRRGRVCDGCVFVAHLLWIRIQGRPRGRSPRR